MSQVSNEHFYHLLPSGDVQATNMYTGEVTIINKEPKLYLKYSLPIGETICELIRDGKTFTEIAKVTGVPASAIYRWRTLHPDFNEKINAARTDRAEVFHGKMVEIVEELAENTDDNVLKNEKTRFEMYSKLAAIDNPATFGNKTTISGDGKAPIQIVLDTGIRRQPIDDASTVQLEREQSAIIAAAEEVVQDVQQSIPLDEPPPLPFADEQT